MQTYALLLDLWLYVHDICACTSTINKFTSLKISFYMYNVDIFSYYNNNYYMYC